MAKSTISKLVPKALGNPGAVQGLPEGQNELFLGTMYGRADGFARRTMPTGETYIGLRGYFEGIPADDKKEPVTSGVCYLPAGIFESVAALLSDGDFDDPSQDKAGVTVKFAFEVYTQKATNKAGYSYRFSSPVEPSEDDPLADLRKQLPSRRDAAQKAIEEQKAPAADQGKGKAKAA